MAGEKRDPNEIEDLRRLIAQQRDISEACEDLVRDTEADYETYKNAFRRFLEILPDGSRLKAPGTRLLRDSRH